MADLAYVVADVDVDAPAQRVWDVLVAWDRHSEWMLATHMHEVDGDGASVGSQLSAVTGVGRLAFTDTMRIVAWDPPRRCVVEHTGRVVRGRGAFEVVPVPAGRSRVIWSERLELPFGEVGRLGWPLARAASRAALLFSLRRLARLAERG